MNADTVNLTIAKNHLGFRATCPLCRSKFRPEIGPWVFVADTTQPVCPDCIEMRGLTAALHTARENRDRL